jgi:hypothetical protein
MAPMTANVINLTAQAMIEVLAIHYRLSSSYMVGKKEGTNKN